MLFVLWGMGALFDLLSTDFCCRNAFQSFGRSNDGNHKINWYFNLKTGLRLLEVPLFIEIYCLVVLVDTLINYRLLNLGIRCFCSTATWYRPLLVVWSHKLSLWLTSSSVLFHLLHLSGRIFASAHFHSPVLSSKPNPIPKRPKMDESSISNRPESNVILAVTLNNCRERIREDIWEREKGMN